MKASNFNNMLVDKIGAEQRERCQVLWEKMIIPLKGEHIADSLYVLQTLMLINLQESYGQKPNFTTLVARDIIEMVKPFAEKKIDGIV